MKTWKIAGINFDLMHMVDLLRHVHEHPRAEIVGISDEQPARMRTTAANFGLTPERVFTDYRACLEQTRPDLVILCPAPAQHADWTERVAPFGTHVLMEKPFAATLAEADRMIAALAATGKELIINWPLRWYPCHVTAKRLLDEGRIGDLQEVHYYDGNRGPGTHSAGKEEVELTLKEKNASWFYQAAQGGGSLLDYLGYGTTLGTWFHGGAVPAEVTTVTAGSNGLEVDEHSVTMARYAGRGLSKFETRWGTFTDPWTHQPQPKCGFVLKGSAGTISSYDYETTIRVQTAARPEGEAVAVDVLAALEREPISYVLDRLERGLPIEGPLSPAVCRVGQQIVDAARHSAAEKRTVAL